MRVIGIDFGRKRIGVAVAEGRVVFPVETIERRSLKRDLETLRSRFCDAPVSLVVVGLPLGMDGSEGPAARGARAFAEHLRRATGLKVEMFDERLTSVEADERLRAAQAAPGARKMARDAIAAAVMLEGWLASVSPTHPALRQCGRR